MQVCIAAISAAELQLSSADQQGGSVVTQVCRDKEIDRREQKMCADIDLRTANQYAIANNMLANVYPTVL